jgi:vacuolar-type H+-ATPase subunit F/Vma7
MNPVQVVGDHNTVQAFALGGVPGHVVHTADEARTAMDAVIEALRSGGGPVQHPTLVLITHRTADRIREYLDRLILDTHGPLVLEIPGFAEPLGESPLERFVARVLRVQL